MRFNGNVLRHEQKYVINQIEYRDLYAKLKAVMKADPHCGDDGYFIRSLYFDDVFDSAYAEKASGVEYRRKYRIRIYDGSDSIIKLERKDKFSDFIAKSSVSISRDEFYAISGGGDISFLLGGPSNSMPSQMYCDIRTKQLRPAVIVDYRRDVFICDEGNVRITFDRELKAGIGSHDIFSDVTTVNAFEPGLLVLEVKYDDYLPSHIRRLLTLSSSRREAVSKYVYCRDAQRLYDPAASCGAIHI